MEEGRLQEGDRILLDWMKRMKEDFFSCENECLISFGETEIFDA